MVNLHLDKTVNIIVPNTNRALQELIQTSSPEEFQRLSQGKDLSSILDSFLGESSKNESSNKALLDLLKNNPTFKDLGSVTSSAKELLNSLKQSSEGSTLEKQFSKFFTSIESVNGKELQTKVENSGLFLESKIKELQTPQMQLKTSVQELAQLLQNSKVPNAQLLNSELQKIINSDTFKNISNTTLLTTTPQESSTLEKLSQQLQKITEGFAQTQNSAVDKSLHPKDQLFSKETTQLLQKVQELSSKEHLQNTNATKETLAQDVKATLLKAQEEISNSNIPNKQELLKHIDKMLLSIDYNQLLSHLTQNTSLYIPYSWENLEEGKFSIKKGKNSKFFTDIELQLKEYGSLHLRLGLFEGDQLNINITTESQELKKQLQEAIPILRGQLKDVGITPSSIRFLDESSHASSEAYQLSKDVNTGFEVKA